MAETIRLEIDARGVAALTLARAEKHNSLSAQMIAELREAAAAIAADKAIRVVVLTGEGESFCAGGDLGWMKRQFGADRATRIAEARHLADMLGALNTLPQPLIGRVNGQAYGGGMGMLSVCDVAIEGNVSNTGLMMWTRGDDIRYDEPPLCGSCAQSISVSAWTRWQ